MGPTLSIRYQDQLLSYSVTMNGWTDCALASPFIVVDWRQNEWSDHFLNLIIQRSSIITYLCVFDILDKCHQNRIFVIHLTYIFKLGWQNGQVDHYATVLFKVDWLRWQTRPDPIKNCDIKVAHRIFTLKISSKDRLHTVPLSSLSENIKCKQDWE